MSWIDTAIIAAYLLGTTLFGCSFMFRKGGRDADGFMTGGGRLPTWTVALSIFATHVSSIAFLGLPAKASTSLDEALPMRPPMMCAGCPHRGIY